MIPDRSISAPSIAAAAGLLLVGPLPGEPVLTALLGHVPIGMPLVAVAWILVGLRLLRTASPT